jgi:hypothetical protein
MRRSFIEFRDGLPQSGHLGHSLHCFDSLLQDMLCDADDTPRYTGGGQPRGSSGMGQKRMCRDWRRLEAWAKENTACWMHINDTQHDIDTLERYKFCPPGSPYQKRIQAVFGDFETPQRPKSSFAGFWDD